MRHAFATLADAKHTLPLPTGTRQLFSPAGQMINLDDPYWIAALNDGSIVLSPTPALTAPAAEPGPTPTVAAQPVPTKI